jgi:UDPglucose 6-dehydrogenase
LQKFSFINEVANLCEELGVDIEQVRRGVGMDPRIGRAYFAPGLGYGGSCLPKDLRAILTIGQQWNAPLDPLGAVHQVNNNQPMCLSEKIQNQFNGVVLGRRISIWGLAYKSGTDDLREAPAIPLIHSLVKAGAQVTAYDPKANGVAWALLGEEVLLSDDQYGCLQGAEALVVATDWDEFREADLARVRSMMVNPLIFDGRNIYCPEVGREHGFIYFGVGRPSAPVESPLLMIDTQG